MNKNNALNLREIDAMILDLDGVITQTAKVHARAWKQMFDECLERQSKREGRPCHPFDVNDDYAKYVDGKPRYDGVCSFLKSRSIDLPFGNPDDDPGRETICGLGNRKNHLFLELIERDGVEPFEDTVDRLQYWRSIGLKTAVVSSSKNCKEVVEAAGLGRLFDVRVDGIVAEQLNLKGKPAPDIFLRAAGELGVEPFRAVVFEDAISGVQAGRAGKFLHVIGVARRGQAKALAENGADIVVSSFDELKFADERQQPGNLPSALQNQAEIERQITRRKPLVFLDYDGTLTPIVSQPEDAVLSDEMRQVLKSLALCCTVAIVSGRDRADVKNLIRIDELIYAGSHGFDITGPNDLRMQHEEGRDCLPELDQVEQELRDELRRMEGARVERKRFSIAVHYRNAFEKDIPRIKEIADEKLRKHRRLKKGLGKKVIELLPNIDWNKGQAVLWLMNRLGFDGGSTLPIYIGDDITDEDAFRVLIRRGLGILVGDHGQPSAAKYRLRDVEEVKQFLSQLVKLFQEKRL